MKQNTLPVAFFSSPIHLQKLVWILLKSHQYSKDPAQMTASDSLIET